MLKRALRPVWTAVRRSPPAAVLMGIRLGARTPAEVQAQTDRHYSRRKDYAADQHNLRGWYEWEQTLVSALLPPAGRMFVYAAGGAREVIALARAGYDVDACECHPDMVASANARLDRLKLTPRVRRVPADDAPSSEQTYDAIVIGWTAYGHIQGRAARLELLRALYDMAAPSAPLIVSFHMRTEGSKPLGQVHRTANLLRRLRSEPLVEEGDALGRYFMHMFTRGEITDEMREGGWNVVAFYEGAHGYAAARRSA